MNNLKNHFVRILNDLSEKWLDTVVSVALGPALTEKAIASIVTDIARNLIANTIQEKLTPSEAKDIRDRAKVAAAHIEEATQIINELQVELKSKNDELDQLMEVVAARQEEATHWANLASVNEELASSFTRELEKRVREQLRAELDRGKRQRQIIGAVSWVITLILGAILGVLVQKWWPTGSTFPFPTSTPLP